MNNIIKISLVFTIFLFNSCIKGAEKKSTNNNIPKITLNNNQKKYLNDTIDLSSMKLSDDSLDLKLFNLVSENDKYSKQKLFQNIEILINKGANPNAVIEYTYSYRKLGSYIPIVKSFYRNKYRTVKDNSTAFHIAVNSRKTFLVKKLIELGADVNISDNNKILPVDVALKNNDIEMVNILLANNCKVEKANLSVCSDVELIKKMVKHGANPKTIDINFALNDENILKEILNLNVDVNAHKLDYRKIFKNETILDILLQHGLNNSAKGTFPTTNEALIYGAIKYGNLNTIKKLKNAGINIMQKKKSANKYITPIIDVVESGKHDILEYYIENGANVNEKDWTGRSVLHSAIDRNDEDAIKILIKAGANKEYTGYFNKTPFMHAVQMDKYISAQVLINEGVKINYKNKYQDTALSIAIKNKKLPMIKLLIESGADIQQKIDKMNIVEYAKSVNAQDIIINYLQNKLNKN